MKHRNMHIGDLYLCCRDNVIWRVEYRGSHNHEGPVVYSNHRRYMARKTAARLDKLMKSGTLYNSDVMQAMKGLESASA